MARAKTDIAEKISRYEASNLESARVILADHGRYGGEHSLMVIWAKLVMSRDADSEAKELVVDM